jgi:hypothetical protein
MPFKTSTLNRFKMHIIVLNMDMYIVSQMKHIMGYNRQINPVLFEYVFPILFAQQNYIVLKH